MEKKPYNYWGHTGCSLSLSLLEGESIETIWTDEDYFYVKTNLDRVYKSVSYGKNKCGILFLDMIELTEDNQ